MKTFVALILVFFLVTAVQAVTIDMVPVGNPGNAPDTRYNNYSFGSVDHVYQIGKYEVTAGEYTEFLNAVAQEDPNALYNPNTGSLLAGARIQRIGSSPNYSYSVAADWANRPVNYVSFWDAARFANWLDNGQPTGPQGPDTTEGGAYHDVGNQSLFGRNAGAKFFLPTEDEWYKAAYHDATAGLDASYFDYPTGTDAVPGRDINETTNPGNNANYFDSGYVIGGPYYRTVVGEFELSDSPYGTFDQGGNVFEWNETAVESATRGLSGGSFRLESFLLRADIRSHYDPAYEEYFVGFRVASVPALGEIGDYNNDGQVDAADYVVWRKNEDTTNTLPNDLIGGTIGSAQYDQWRAHFGQTASSGVGESANAAIPEPTTLVLLLVGMLAIFSRRFTRVS